MGDFSDGFVNKLNAMQILEGVKASATIVFNAVCILCSILCRGLYGNGRKSFSCWKYEKGRFLSSCLYSVGYMKFSLENLKWTC